MRRDTKEQVHEREFDWEFSRAHSSIVRYFTERCPQASRELVDAEEFDRQPIFSVV